MMKKSKSPGSLFLSATCACAVLRHCFRLYFAPVFVFARALLLKPLFCPLASPFAFYHAYQFLHISSTPLCSLPFLLPSIYPHFLHLSAFFSLRGT